MLRTEGIMYFPYGIWFKKSTLGREFEIRISKYKGILALPRYPAFSKNKYQLILHKKLRPPKNIQSRMYEDKNVNWGSPVQYPEGYSEVLCAALYFDFTNASSRLKNSKKIYSASQNWLTRFQEFTEIFSGQEIARKAKVLSRNLEIDLWFYNNMNKANHITGQSRSSISIPTAGQIIDTRLFRRILDYCSNGFSPNLIHVLFKDAIRAFDNSEFRRAILDASTAIELILTYRLQSKLSKKHSVKVVQSILNKFRTLGNLLNLANDLNCKLPSGDLQNEIVKPRNDAIHRGIVPSSTAARSVLHKCQEMIAIYMIPKQES